VKTKKLLETLFDNNSHILPIKGLNSHFYPFLIGSKKDTAFIDLTKIIPLYKNILLLVRNTFSNRGGVIIILEEKVIPKHLEQLLNKFFIVIRNNWAEGSITNLSMLKKTSSLFNNSGTGGISSKSKVTTKRRRNQLQKFFKKYQTIGFLGTYPRLIIDFTGTGNKLFLKEKFLLNIPIISLVGSSSNKLLNIDYPIIINSGDFIIKLLLRLLLVEAKKGKTNYFSKFRVRRLSYLEKTQFLTQVKYLI